MWPILLKLNTLAAFSIGPCDPTQVNHNSFFGFPPWWKYIHTGNYDGLGNCTPTVDFPSGIWAIAFAVIDMLLYLAGIVAVVSIIIAGISYITAAGNAEEITSARKRIVNSLIGLAIVLIAAAVVSFVGNAIG
jgi:hypothetical protein